MMSAACVTIINLSGLQIECDISKQRINVKSTATISKVNEKRFKRRYSNSSHYHLSHKRDKIYVYLDTKLFQNVIKDLLEPDVSINNLVLAMSSYQTNHLYIIESVPTMFLIDYPWGEILERLVRERQELDSMFAWLSTLGGAFSALGENKSLCAFRAGQISMEQFKLAVRLGDPDLQARCRLYFSISLIQTGKLKVAKKIILTEFQNAMATAEEFRDKRLIKMCKGIWARLQYEYQIKHHRIKHY